MTYVDEAFEAMKQKAEVKPGSQEQDQAIARHTAVREHVETEWDVERSFLTGSYARHTKIRPLRDVDIFLVVNDNGEQADLRDEESGAVLAALDALLSQAFDTEVDVPAVRVSYSPDDDITSFEVVPAFNHRDRGFVIPDGQGGWMRTDPSAHAELASAKNAECDEKWVPLVKMVKGWNREVGEPIDPSFLIEVMALDLVRPPVSTYPDELVTFFENARLKVSGPWPDPAGLGSDVDRGVTATERDEMKAALTRAGEIAEHAVELEDEGDERGSVEKWRELFGDRMPRP